VLKTSQEKQVSTICKKHLPGKPEYSLKAKELWTNSLHGTSKNEAQPNSEQFRKDTFPFTKVVFFKAGILAETHNRITQRGVFEKVLNL
jgi:hypothetical protein